jgi:polysaccharide pyruvyl transferase WcaK-like protein
MVAALSLAVPVLVLGWSHKYFEVMNDFGLNSFVRRYQSLNVEEIYNLIENLFDNKKVLANQINDNLHIVKKSSKKQFKYLFKLLKE